MTTRWFVPATFQLVEADILERSPERWIAAWEGLVGEPADEVTLGWRSAAQREALITTSQVSPFWDEPEQHFKALRTLVHSSIGDPLGLRSLTPDALASLATDLAWRTTQVRVDGGWLEATTTEPRPGIAVGALTVEHRAVCIALQGLDDVQWSLRNVLPSSGAAYQLDPAEPADLAAFRQQPALQRE